MTDVDGCLTHSPRVLVTFKPKISLKVFQSNLKQKGLVVTPFFYVDMIIHINIHPNHFTPATRSSQDMHVNTYNWSHQVRKPPT